MKTFTYSFVLIKCYTVYYSTCGFVLGGRYHQLEQHHMAVTGPATLNELPIRLTDNHYSSTQVWFDPSPFSSQVTVWGDYGRLEGKKVFMGVAQIMLDQLDLSKMEIGWYKLFGTSALVNPAGLSLSRRSSLASLDSVKL